MSNLYRKKPVVIEAFQISKKIWLDFVEHGPFRFTRNFSDYPEWLQKAFAKDKRVDRALYAERFWNGEMPEKENMYWELRINTLEGPHTVSIGDWIIKGVKGELYPCKPDIFKATYEKV